MKNILIPIDFKFNGYDAIDYAVQFFNNEACHFYFLNTYTYDVDGLNAIHLLKVNEIWFGKPKEDSEMCLGRVIQNYTFKNNSNKHVFDAISECTNLLDGIKKAIKELDIDLVVLAGKEQTNNDRDKYSKNTKRIIENIRECPVMIIPVSAHIQTPSKFVLVSNFERDLSTTELENWYALVKIANGSIQIVTLSSKENLSELQKTNQNKVRHYLELLSENTIKVEFVENAPALKDFAKYHSDYIICLMDRKPDFWRKLGITHSHITELGPLPNTPLIALHR